MKVKMKQWFEIFHLGRQRKGSILEVKVKYEILYLRQPIPYTLDKNNDNSIQEITHRGLREF